MVRLKETDNILVRIYLKYFKRFRVKELYAWMQSKWDSTTMITEKNGIIHDGFKISKELQNTYPRGYQLQGNWTITESSLKTLVNGPLISQNGDQLLVRPHGWFVNKLLFISKYSNIISLLIGILGIILTVVCN